MDKVLHLTLLKKWFVEIFNNQKKIEYREIKPYWTKRLFEGNKPKKYDYIFFRNGYDKNCPMMKVEFLGVRKKGMYEIMLGEVLDASNVEKLNLK